MTTKRRKLSYSCESIRTVLVRRGTLNMFTGAMGSLDSGTHETGPCNVPLFSKAETEAGRCRACLKDPTWEIEGNRPATPEELSAYLEIK